MSKDKGWYEGRERQPLEFHMLMVTEIAEASEEVRNKKPSTYVVWEGNEVEPDGSINRLNRGNLSSPDGKEMKEQAYWDESLGIAKPEGEAVELADAVIRIGDYFAMRGWDLEAVVKLKMNYNATRPHRHGGKAL
jgi:hypothetical protein